MEIVGITWDKSVLVSFDPYTGNITEKHAWLKVGENFVGLAHNYNRNKLYALAQVSFNLYSIDPLTRDVKLAGKLQINGQDVSGLSYDPDGDVLYTVVLHFGPGITNPWSELAKVNADTASVTVVGKIAEGLCNSLCWREYDGRLNSYLVSASGSWDSPYKASVISIDSHTAAMVPVFQTPYHAIMGLARKPGEDAYFSWVNSDTLFYGEVNLGTKTITDLAPSNAGVQSGAMLYKNFYVAPAPNLPPCSFSDEDCLA